MFPRRFSSPGAGPLLPSAASRSCSCRRRCRRRRRHKHRSTALSHATRSPGTKGGQGVSRRYPLQASPASPPPPRKARVPVLGSGASCGFQEGSLRTRRQRCWGRGWRWRNRSSQAGRESRERVAAESFLGRQVPPVSNSRWSRLLPDPTGPSREGPEDGEEGWTVCCPGLWEPGVQHSGRLRWGKAAQGMPKSVVSPS